MSSNPLGLDGIEFVEFAAGDPTALSALFEDFGFAKVSRHLTKNIDLYRQGDIQFLLNHAPKTYAANFFEEHGPSISAMGWRFRKPREAFRLALAQGARPCWDGDYYLTNGEKVPVIYGIGGSLIYFLQAGEQIGFVPLQDPKPVEDKGFCLIDHLTNNVAKGTMKDWALFYKRIFGFTEVRHFDIKGQKTGLTSYALRSPCGKFCIPINEADEAESQINEFLEEYRGPGIQHLAFLTKDLLTSLEKLRGSKIETLDISPGYYDSAFNRVPGLREDKKRIQDFNVLVDGDEKGYLLQIFTKKLIGPIFIELIQRENHLSFGEGNFQALFDSIERDQMKRGVL